MPSLPEVRAVAGPRTVVRGGGIAGSATGGWTMARRAGGALASLLLVGLALPVALLAGPPQPAVAAASGSAQGPVSVVITGMTPRQAAPRTTITVSGTLTNTSGQQISHLAVQLLHSSSPVTSSAELDPATAEADGLAAAQVSGALWQTVGQLQGGATVHWSIKVKASALGLTVFGAYPLAAQAISTLVQVPLATTYTYLPYVPAGKGPYGSSVPRRTTVAWVWPLIDQPMLTPPWFAACRGSQAQQLAASLTSTGRLGGLLTAGADGSDVTWAIDPALLANVRSLTRCSGARAGWAVTARAWLARLGRLTATEPVFATPYADPLAAALIAASHAADVRRAFQLGRLLGGRILHRDLNPPAAGTSASAQSEAAAIAWPAGGIDGYPTLENLAAADGVRTVVLGSSALPGAPSSVLTTANGLGGYLHLVLASSALTSILAGGDSAGGSAFASAQEVLAETALLAEQHPGQPIVAAPPQRWSPPQGLASQVLTATSSAPWLTPASVISVSTARHQPAVSQVTTGGQWGRVNRRLLRQLTGLDQQIGQLQSIKVRPDASLYQAVATIESSAWRGRSRATAMALLATVSRDVSRQQQAVQVVVENRVTLGGLKGTVPVSIENRLGYPVQVRLRLQVDAAGGNVKITQQPAGLITIAARTAETVRLRVQASQVGSTVVSMTVQNRDYQTLPYARTQRMTIQTTEVGVLGVIICAIALGVLLIAYAARAARRGRQDPGSGLPEPAGSPTGAGPDRDADSGAAAGAKSATGHTGPTSDDSDLRRQGAEPDTVMAERGEPGAARPPLA